MDLISLQNAMGIAFNDTSLLVRALTHRSYVNEQHDVLCMDNERLEYLGDAVLDFIVAEHLYRRLPEISEGKLTGLRAALVRRETLAEVARRLRVGENLLMGRGEAESGGRERPATLCAALEALIGALYLDQGIEITRERVLAWLSPELTELQNREWIKDAKSQLQELTQRKWGCIPEYMTVEIHGPDHAREFTVEVIIDGKVYGRGTGASKQAATQQAAKIALTHFLQQPADQRANGTLLD